MDLVRVGVDPCLLLEHLADGLHREVPDIVGVHAADGGPLLDLHQAALGGHLDRLLLSHDDLGQLEADDGRPAGDHHHARPGHGGVSEELDLHLEGAGRHPGDEVLALGIGEPAAPRPDDGDGGEGDRVAGSLVDDLAGDAAFVLRRRGGGEERKQHQAQGGCEAASEHVLGCGFGVAYSRWRVQTGSSGIRDSGIREIALYENEIGVPEGEKIDRTVAQIVDNCDKRT